MATDCRQQSPANSASKRRKITYETIPRKLLSVHEKVEVRRLEDGFLGSWHTATVICCEHLSRLVQYDHILSDDGSSHLIEYVKVTPLLDGLVTRKMGMSSNYPSIIRPSPPSCILEPQHLHYGQLVDCFYGDAWWEGVIFDDKDGDQNRNVFFPDMGDEVYARMNMLRISQDWDEVTEEWKPRANWLFLEILEELDHDWPLPVSVKQIWYELRVKSGFGELKDWNSSERSIWRSLVLEVLSDNFKICFMHLAKELNSAWDSALLGQSLLDFSESVLDSILQSEALLNDPPADIPFKATCHYHQVEQSDTGNLEPKINLTTSGEALSVSHALPTSSNNPDEVSQTGYSNYGDEALSNGVRLLNEESMHTKRLERIPAPDFIPASNYFPNAIVEANEMYKLQNNVTSQVSLNARKHLLELGWKVEVVQHEKSERLEYISPDGKRFRSLRKICLLFDSVDQKLAMPSPLSAKSPISKKVPSLHIQKTQTPNKLPKSCIPDVIVVEPEYCPESVNDYYKKCSSSGQGKHLKLEAWRAKQHLSATGWSFEPSGNGVKKRWRYKSPTGRSFSTLRAACKWCLQLGTGSQNDCGPTQGEMANVISQDACTSGLVVIKPEYCPESVKHYYNKCSSCVKAKYCKLDALKAKQHLSATGWSFDYVHRQNSWKMRYRSPTGRVFYNLLSACKWCFQVGTVSQDHCGPILGETGNASFQDDGNSALGETGNVSSQDDCTPGLVVIKPEYCPESVNDYYNKCSSSGRGKNWTLDGLKVKRHLSATGWSFDYIYKRSQDRWKMCFRSPTGRTFYSLLSACKWCLQVGTVSQDDCGPTLGEIGNVNCIKDSAESISVNGSNLRQTVVDSGEKPSLVNDKFEKPLNQSKGLVEMMEVEKHENHHHKLFPSGTSQPRRRGRKSRGFRKEGKAINTYSTPVQSNRRAGEVAESTSQTSKNILSWLIDNNVVLPRSKVRCQGDKDSHPVQQGRITREGIKCSCCHKTFSLGRFQKHAGITNSIPAANIYLLDGRSLLDCQAQLNQNKSNGNSRSESCQKLTGSQENRTNDNACAICRYGGELVLCDQCPSSFHTHCLGLKEVPSGDWFCPSCCCKICAQGGFNDKIEPVTETSILICNQCECKYHVGCVNIERVPQLERNPEGLWFCRNTCEQIYYGLRKSLGMPVSLGTGNLSWTLVKYIKPESYVHDTFAAGYLIESHSKLNIALRLMHECFEPIEEPGSKTDLVEDVIFSRSSELNRLNFQGFYTVLLEKDDELISAATVRIYGDRVAEIPLVATCIQHRRLGMCRILMNELEKKLIELGVERLVLPAVPSVLNTWTTSFGFSIMNESERLSLLDYTFLCFQGTVICQKLLTGVSSAASSLSTEEFVKNGPHVMENVYTELDDNSAVTEVLADHVVATEDGTEDNNGNGHVQVDQPSNPNYLCSTTLDSPVVVTGHEQVEDNNKAAISNG